MLHSFVNMYSFSLPLQSSSVGMMVNLISEPCRCSWESVVQWLSQMLSCAVSRHWSLSFWQWGLCTLLHTLLWKLIGFDCEIYTCGYALTQYSNTMVSHPDLYRAGYELSVWERDKRELTMWRSLRLRVQLSHCHCSRRCVSSQVSLLSYLLQHVERTWY